MLAPMDSSGVLAIAVGINIASTSCIDVYVVEIATKGKSRVQNPMPSEPRAEVRVCHSCWSLASEGKRTMQRWHRERHIARKRQLEHILLVHHHPEQPIDCDCERQVGRFRKRDAFDCGRARCYLCHGDKLLKRPRRVDRLALLKLREGIDDLACEH